MCCRFRRQFVRRLPHVYEYSTYVKVMDCDFTPMYAAMYMYAELCALTFAHYTVHIVKLQLPTVSVRLL